MKKRFLGSTEIQVAPLAFGGNIFGWTVDEPTSFSLLDAFVEAGFNMVDTADMYSNWAPGNSGGESETIIGNWIKRSGARNKIVLATKIGTDLGQGRKGLSKARILRGVEDSLQRLQTDYIDLYQSHIDDSDAPLEETLGAYQQLVAQGKVRAIGASNYAAPRLELALETSRKLGLSRYQSLQPEYNLCERSGYEAELEPLCLREHLAVIPYFPLAAGFLSGKYRSEADLANRARGGMVKKYLNDRGLRILAALDTAAADYQVTPAAIALAWLIARPSITAPIASATSLEQLNDLVKAATLELSTDTVAHLNAASA